MHGPLCFADVHTCKRLIGSLPFQTSHGPRGLEKKSTARMWIPYVGWFRRLRCKGSEDVWDKGHVRYNDKVLSATLRVEGSDGFLNI